MYTRTHPFHAHIQERSLLTSGSSTKKTYHIVLSVPSLEFPFKVGDSIAVYPRNDPEEVHRILKKLSISPSEEIIDPKTKEIRSIEEHLLHKANLSKVTSSLIKLLVEKGAPLAHLLESENKLQLSQELQENTLYDWICHAPLSPLELVKNTMPLLPRFYSIANSPKVFPNEIHLLVAYVEYPVRGEIRRGIGSHFLCDLAQPHSTSIPIYLQPTPHFTLPEDPSASIILIGPGTGIAPYRAFIQERLATQASGRNWIFFGERNRATDFYYADFWLDLEKQERIRLDLAFSRDGKEKLYVQHKMYEQRKSLWNWIENGATIYVCGDAQKMAKDVDATLQTIIKEEGSFSEEDARLYLKKMRVEKRYLTDVY